MANIVNKFCLNQSRFSLNGAKGTNTVEAYEKYLNKFPQGQWQEDARRLLDPVLFKWASEEDWYSAYEKYIRDCPTGTNVAKAKERLEWLKQNRAEVEIDYPKVLEQRLSPYSNVSSPFWGWDTTFREKSGKIGFRVRGSGYILDPKGGRWDPNRKEVKVAPGKSGKDDYWCSSSDHVLCNGEAIFTWTGEDAGGHSIKLEERVKLQHTGCPGPRK